MFIPNRRIGAKRPGVDTIYSPGDGWTGHLSGEGPPPLPDPPTITNFVPTSGEVGISVVITGTGFDTANRVQFFNGVNASFVIDSPTQITATVPAGAETGPINVRNPGGTAVSAGDFTVEVPVGAPVVTSFFPTTGSEDEQITLTGTDFTGSTAVTIGGGNCPTFFVDNDTTIRVNISGLARSGKIAVTNPQGTGVSVDNFHVEQQVLSYTPNSGQENDPIQINGQNFLDASAVTFFNGVNQPVFTVVDNTRIDCNVPAGASDGAISVTTPWGTKSGPSFDVLPKAPTVSSYTPDNAEVGDPITINGTDFVEVSAVTFFNGVDQPVFTVQSPTAITCNVPAGAATGAISVTNPGGTGVGPSFTVNPPAPELPVVSSFLPTNGQVGTSVVITGQNFSAATAVDFNGTNATQFTIDSATQITADVPDGATTGPIGVTNSAGRGESAGSFTVDAPAGGMPAGWGYHFTSQHYSDLGGANPSTSEMLSADNDGALDNGALWTPTVTTTTPVPLDATQGGPVPVVRIDHIANEWIALDAAVTPAEPQNLTIIGVIERAIRVGQQWQSVHETRIGMQEEGASDRMRFRYRTNTGFCPLCIGIDNFKRGIFIYRADDTNDLIRGEWHYWDGGAYQIDSNSAANGAGTGGMDANVSIAPLHSSSSKGAVGEIYIYDSILSDADILDAVAELKTRWDTFLKNPPY